MFTVTTKDIGIVKAGQKQTILFPYTELGKIIATSSSCDCSTPKNDMLNKQIVVTYIPKQVPVHLQEMDKTQYAIRKEIIIESATIDGTTRKDTLVFTGIVSK